MSTRVLVIKLGALGDVIQALGPLAAIRHAHREARITALTAPPFADLLAASPYVDEVWVDTRPPVWRVDALVALRRRLRRARFAMVYDLQTSARSGWYFHLLGPGARPPWSGIARGCSHPHANPARDGMHTLDRQAEQLGMAGIAVTPPPDASWLTADIGRFGLRPPFALLAPGGSADRPAKRWPVERYAALARGLAARGITPVVLGTAPERPLAAAIVAATPGTRDLTSQTSLGEIAALARAAVVAVGNDSGPMHLIAVAGAPAVVLFSAESDPALCAPRAPAVRVLRRLALADLPAAEVEATLRSISDMR